MKVIDDKLKDYPFHAICKKDISVIFSALPAEWTAGIHTVRLCSSRRENPMVIAWFNTFDGCLTIKSRGLPKERVVWSVLAELAGCALGVTFLGGRRLQKRDESRVRRIIAPLVEEILPQLLRGEARLDR